MILAAFAVAVAWCALAALLGPRHSDQLSAGQWLKVALALALIAADRLK